MLNNLSIAEVILFSVFSISLIIQLVYYWGVFSHLAFYKPPQIKNPSQPVSIILCARNEAANLRNNLLSVLEQDYQNFEVVVVNDCSWDDSGSFLEEMGKKYSNLKVLTIKEQEKYRHGKKFALTLGIKAAQHEVLLMIDADCKVYSRNWLALMQNNFSNTIDITLGYGPYQKKSGLLNRFIRLDAFYTALQYLSFSMMGMTYMGVGRNLSYRKSVFFKNKGFAAHQHVLSGDDDLFVNSVATKTNVAIELDPQSFTYSEPQKTWKNWMRQKVRHFSTAAHYKTKHKTALVFLTVSQFLFYSALFALIVVEFEWRLLLILFIVRLASQLVVFGKAMKILQEKELWWMLPLFDLFSLIFYPILTVTNMFVKVHKWK
jgi:biofilm PGA synthesis N-glycosyltransferase PgaC